MRDLFEPPLSLASLGQASIRFSRRSALLAPLVLSIGCLELRNQDPPDDDFEMKRCATCHGDPKREGDALSRAAPPFDLNQNTDTPYPGVGAHELHLRASDTHAAVACDECHIVPESVDSPGHADNESPADVIFGELATTGNRSPEYDASRFRCSDTWCHLEGEPLWTWPKSPESTCGTCHGLPPAAPHPQAENCSTCHGEVIDDDRSFIHPEKHVDGVVQYEPSNCQTCHGDNTSSAPPQDISGNTEATFVGVGAHRAHLLGSGVARPLKCSECHLVPERVEDEGHLDGLPAEVELSGISDTGMRSPTWDPRARTCESSYCHSPREGENHSSPEWTSQGPLACDSCHGSPPAAPHPQMTQCENCHSEVVGADDVIVAPELHVDGILQVSVPQECNACHGSENPAPPTDVWGNASTTFLGVGAHQTHVLGTELSRAVPCDECHQIPQSVLESGHIDTFSPAEVLFSGVATSFDAPITYEDGSCRDSYCHGAVFFEGRLSGGTNTEPDWTTVDGTEAACGTCHGLPPPSGHPQVDDCAYCHRNVRPDNRSFYDKSLHVNGITENYIP